MLEDFRRTVQAEVKRILDCEARRLLEEELAAAQDAPRQADASSERRASDRQQAD